MFEAALSYDEQLTNRLRHTLAPLHTEVEDLMDLPGRLRTLPDYAACLRLFHAVFAPLETVLSAHEQWDAWGIDFDQRRRAPALREDLRALDAEDPDDAPLHPARFTDFSEAFGALYVLEGSTLGGKVILAAVNRALGPAIAGATRFFAGHGASSGPLWRDFKLALDAYGQAHPARCDAVVSGAARCYALFAQAAARPWP